MSIYTKYKQADFEKWIFEMDDKLDSFINSIYGDVKHKFDFSIESLNVAESWLKEKYKTPEDLDKLHRAVAIDGFVRYVGEVFRKYARGFWDMDFDSEESIEAGPYVKIDKIENCRIYPYVELKKAISSFTDHHLMNKFLDLLHQISSK